MSFHDVLDLVRALAWPLVALAALVVLRHALPEIARDFARRATKIAVFEFAVELAPAAAPPGDARPPAVALLGAPVLGPSLLPALVAELEKTAPADYLVVDLLGERGWLTSRLFLWAELLGRTRSLRCFVFVRSGASRRFVALAAVDDVRWTLSRAFPWFEQKLALAYNEVVPGFPTAAASDRATLAPNVAKAVAERFIVEVQAADRPSTDPGQWVRLATQTWEHAEWLTRNRLESLLGPVLARVPAVKTLATKDAELADQVLRADGRYVAVVSGDRRFVGVADRYDLLAQRIDVR